MSLEWRQRGDPAALWQLLGELQCPQAVIGIGAPLVQAVGADRCSQRDIAITGAGTIDGFRQRETVGIVGEAHVAPQRRFEVALERLADQAGRVGVLDQARDARFGTRYADAHRSASTDSFFSRSDQFDHRSQCRGVVALRRRHALAQQDVAIVAEDDDLDLAAAEVDADAHQVLCRITCRTIP